MPGELASLEFAFGGEPLQALGDRALYWPARNRLLVADLHLGKGDVFRRAGIAVPRGGTAQDLARLDALLAATGARELWVLGDLVHGPVPDAAWLADWQAWRDRQAELRVTVVAGNHDRALAGAAPASALLGVELLPAVLHDGPFVLRHDPPRGDPLVADRPRLDQHPEIEPDVEPRLTPLAGRDGQVQPRIDWRLEPRVLGVRVCTSDEHGRRSEQGSPIKPLAHHRLPPSQR